MYRIKKTLTPKALLYLERDEANDYEDLGKLCGPETYDHDRKERYSFLTNQR